MRIRTHWLAAGVLLVGLGCAREEAARRAEAPLPGGPLRHEIAVGTEGYEPASVPARKGEPVTLVFTRTTEETCGTELVIPSRDVRVPLPLGEPVEVVVRTDEAGEIVFGCGMEMMLKGKIVVQ
jgi:plastocyanin domain-containing protein